MAKVKSKKKKIQDRVRVIVTSDLIRNLKGQGDLPYVIMSASLKDDFCNYSYAVTKGIGENDEHGVTGSKMVTDDLIQSFQKLNVHLAVIDDVFKHRGIEIDDIDKFHSDENATMYSVTGFKVKGSEENESVVLMGNKSISCSGSRIDLVSPKIPVGNLGSYQWYNELKAAIDRVRLEVSMYKEGKYIAYEDDENKEDGTQLTIGHAIAENQKEQQESPELEDEFSNAKM